MSCGIYKITNKINNKSYIGCSKNIEHRWIAHKSESILEHNPQYNYSIHKAFRKYGLDNFDFSILELTSESQLFEKEKYWINYYNTYENGYNETIGGDCGPQMPGESNPNSKLTEMDVIAIRTEILNGKMLSEVYPNYAMKISQRGFEHIWRGESWLDVLPKAIEYVHSKEYISKIRSFAGKKGLTDEKQKIKDDIKTKKEKGLRRLDVYKDYENIYSLSGFNKIWYKL